MARTVDALADNPRQATRHTLGWSETWTRRRREEERWPRACPAPSSDGAAVRAATSPGSTSSARDVRSSSGTSTSPAMPWWRTPRSATRSWSRWPAAGAGDRTPSRPSHAPRPAEAGPGFRGPAVVTEPVPADEAGREDAPPGLDALPEPVRARVVALAAVVLPHVAGLPAALRRVADFAPARRARLGGGALMAALADDELRERVATQVAARPGRDDDPIDAAARAWLGREAGWREVLERAEETAGRPRERGNRKDDAELERLRERVSAAEQAVKDARSKARSQVEGYKSDNATLRRKLGEARAAERRAREAAEEAIALAQEARTRATSVESTSDKELRRLRARVEQLEAEQSAQRSAERRTTRADKDEATVRARLLLDAVIDAATGLRRELALP